MIRSETYLNFIRRQACIVCAGTPSDPHHFIRLSAGVGAKGDDTKTIPLCREHHNEAHRVGRTTFQARHNFDYWEEAFLLLEKYVTEVAQWTRR